MVIKKIFKQVMSILNKPNPKSVSEKEADFFLEKQEIELILLIIKDPTNKIIGLKSYIIY